MKKRAGKLKTKEEEDEEEEVNYGNWFPYLEKNKEGCYVADPEREL